jgi:hypothetical protein
MSDAKTKFGTMLNCMDGRTQEPVAKWMMEQFGLDVIDAPNPAGPTNMVVNGEQAVKDHYKKEVLISINGHHSKHLVIIAHQDCAANPISDDEQIAQIKEACGILMNDWELPEGVQVIGLWLTKVNDLKWDINRIFTGTVKAESTV